MDVVESVFVHSSLQISLLLRRKRRLLIVRKGSAHHVPKYGNDKVQQKQKQTSRTKLLASAAKQHVSHTPERILLNFGKVFYNLPL